MKKIVLYLGLAAWAGAFLAGCATQQALLRNPAQVASTHNLQVQGEDRERFQRILKETPRDKGAAEACYFLGQAAYNEKDYSQADKYFQKCVRQHPQTGWDADAAYMLAQMEEQKGDTLAAFRMYLALMAPPGFADLPAQASQAAEKLVKEELDLASLNALLGSGTLSPAWQSPVKFRALQLQYQAGAMDAFMKGADDFTRQFPGSPYLAEIQNLTRDAWRKVPTQKRTLGLLVPLAGPGTVYGQEVASGVKLALDDANKYLPEGADKFKLKTVDENGNSPLAMEAARRLVDEDQVICLIGPVRSEPALALSPLITARRVPLISPTAVRQGLTESSAFFFRNCITNEKQGRQMADHVLLDLKFPRCSCLYSATPYGTTLSQAFARRYTELGGTLVAGVSYSAGTMDFKECMLALGGLDPGIGKNAETESRNEIQAGVEQACSGLGAYLLDYLRLTKTAEAQSVLPQDKPARGSLILPTPTPGILVKVGIVDFACDSGAAFFNSGRGISDRFRRILDHLRDKSIGMLAPAQAQAWLDARGKTPEDLNPASAAELARGLGMQLLLAGTVYEDAPDWGDLKGRISRGGNDGARAQKTWDHAAKYRVFKVTAQIVDAASGSIVASRGFEFSKLKPVSSNASSIQALYLACDKTQDVVQIASQLTFYDLKVKMLGSETWHSSYLLRDSENLEGAEFTTDFFADSQAPVVQKFVKAYKERFAVVPGPLAAQSFDAATLVLNLLSKGVETREDLRDALEKTRDFEGVSGMTTFNGNRDAVKKLPILQIKNGEFVQVQ